MTKLKFVFLVSIALGSVSFASTTKSKVGRYCDCYSFRTPNLPVFTRANNGMSLAHYQTHEMQDCVDIHLEQNSNGQIQSIQLGKHSFSFQNLNPGPIYFGVRKKIAHSMQLEHFDPERGGIIKFHYLKNFTFLEALEDDFTVSEPSSFDRANKRPKTADEIREILKGPNWESFDVEIRKTNHGKWAFVDSHGMEINEIVAVMKGKHFFGVGVVTGISEMILSHNPQDSSILANEDTSTFSELKCLKSSKSQ